MEPKWLYRLESLTDDNGLWYNGYGELVVGLADVPNCSTKDMPMPYDERYREGGRNWHSAVTDNRDLTNWFSYKDAKYLVNNGFVFTQYLATEYKEYDKETMFIKETALERIEVSVDEVFEGVTV